MPATSASQRRLFGMVRAAQQGQLKHPSAKIKSMASRVSPQDAHDFAATKHKGLPERKEAAAVPVPRTSVPYGEMLRGLFSRAGKGAITGSVNIGERMAKGLGTPRNAALAGAGLAAIPLTQQLGSNLSSSLHSMNNNASHALPGGNIVDGKAHLESRGYPTAGVAPLARVPTRASNFATDAVPAPPKLPAGSPTTRPFTGAATTPSTSIQPPAKPEEGFDLEHAFNRHVEELGKGNWKRWAATLGIPLGAIALWRILHNRKKDEDKTAAFKSASDRLHGRLLKVAAHRVDRLARTTAACEITAAALGLAKFAASVGRYTAARRLCKVAADLRNPLRDPYAVVATLPRATAHALLKAAWSLKRTNDMMGGMGGGGGADVGMAGGMTGGMGGGIDNEDMGGAEIGAGVMGGGDMAMGNGDFASAMPAPPSMPSPSMGGGVPVNTMQSFTGSPAAGMGFMNGGGMKMADDVDMYRLQTLADSDAGQRFMGATSPFLHAGVGMPIGALAGLVAGATRGNTPEGLGRGIVRGGMTGAGLGLGHGAQRLLAPSLSRTNPTLAALLRLGGAAAGGTAGWLGSGALLGEPSGDAKHEHEKEEQTA